MTKDRDYHDYLDDILDAAKLAVKFVADMSFDDFVVDEKSQYATVRALEIIGEATKNLPPDFRDTHPEIPWRLMTGMRDRLIHGYDTINWQVVWSTATSDLPAIMPKLQALVDSQPESPFS